MYCWRITKYNPIDRDEEGAYIPDHWTLFRDIGEIFEDGLLTYENYKKVETAHTQAILLFMNALRVKNLTIIKLHCKPFYKDMNLLTATMQALYEKKNGQKINQKELPDYMKLIRRNYLSCHLENLPTMMVRFGYDYYMYIVSQQPCYEIHQHIRDLGLFIEAFEPYWE